MTRNGWPSGNCSVCLNKTTLQPHWLNTHFLPGFGQAPSGWLQRRSGSSPLDKLHCWNCNSIINLHFMPLFSVGIFIVLIIFFLQWWFLMAWRLNWIDPNEGKATRPWKNVIVFLHCIWSWDVYSKTNSQVWRVVNVWNVTSPLSGGHANIKAFTHCHYCLWSLNVKFSAMGRKQTLRVTWRLTETAVQDIDFIFSPQRISQHKPWSHFSEFPRDSEKSQSLRDSAVAEQTFLRMVWHSFNVLKESLPFGGRPRRAKPLVGTHTTRSLVWFAD